MAIVVTALGTDENKDQLSLTLTLSFAVGDWIIAVVAGDTAPDSVVATDAGESGANLVLDKDAEAVNSGNVECSIWSGKVLTATVDKWVRALFGEADAKAFTVYKVTGLADSAFDKSATATGTGTDATAGPTATLSQADEVCIGATGVEDEIDDPHGTWTTGATYISGNEQFAATNGAGDASNIQVHSVAEVVSVTTAQNIADTGHDSTNWAAAIATYKGAAAGTTVTPGVIALNGTEYIPVLKHKIVGASPTANVLTLNNAITGYGYVPTTLALSDTEYIPVLKHNIPVGLLALSDTEYAPVLKEVTTPTTLAHTITEYIPILKEALTPTTLALSDTEYVPVLKFSIIPPTLSLSDTEFVPILKLGIIPGTLALITTRYIPVLGFGIIPSTLSLVLTGYASVLKLSIIAGLTALSLNFFAPTVTATSVALYSGMLKLRDGFRMVHRRFTKL